jgi:hypothetical protein
MKTGSLASLLDGVDYEPPLASWPETDFDEKLLINAPVEARYILKKAHHYYQSGYDEGQDVWEDWLELFESYGKHNEGVQVGLLGLSFLRHEARHHLDFYCTPLGWYFPSVIAGQYLRLWQLAHTQPGSPAAEELTGRLARSRRMRVLLFGNVPRLDKNVWHETPLIERKTKLGVFRFRRDRKDPQLTVASIEPMGGTERALSVNSILETRAIIETSLYLAGRLRSVGGSEDQIVSAIELLLSLSVRIARDDYWVLLNVGLPAVNLNDAAKVLTGTGLQCTWLMLATWFALHIQIPDKDKDILWPSNPSLRLISALSEFSKYSDEEFLHPNWDWATVLERLSSIIDGSPLLEIEVSHKKNLEKLEKTLNEGRMFSGLAYEHLSHLLNVARNGFALRRQPLTWLDEVNWNERADPRKIVDWIIPSRNIRTAWSRLTRVDNMVRAGAPTSTLIEVAKSLF